MKIVWSLMLSFLLLLSTTVFAQNADIKAKLEQYHFNSESLTENLKDADAKHSFELKNINTAGDKKTVTISSFDHTKPVGSKWQLMSIDGREPTKKEIKKFNKEHNTKQAEINGKVDDDSYKILEDNEDFLVLGFRYDRSSLPKKYAFLGDCQGKAYLSKASKQLEKATFNNLKDLKISIIKVKKLLMIVDYGQGKNGIGYLIQDSKSNITAKLLGQEVKMMDENYYTYK
ncbi:hypothetical protein [Persicobacter psychrovividus]|uniref:Uncharacterized protein n=1 Tax=Persicobacter psychrovividus TaxID=387638 RepID=A0ABM7VHL5_9BACT|nr:hypothetical protein PEPS_27330 [Persicobacter psychrovividus]